MRRLGSGGDAAAAQRSVPVLRLVHGQLLPGDAAAHTLAGAAPGRPVELRVAAGTGMLAVVRSMTVALAHFEGLSLDVTTDLALAVDEACTALIAMAAAGASLLVVEDSDDDDVTVRLSAACDAPEDDAANFALSGFSRRVLEALTDEVFTFVGNETGIGPVFGISLTAHRPCMTATV